MTNYLEEKPLNLQEMLADKELQAKVNQTIANMFDNDYQIKLAKEFYSEKRYRYCHPQDVTKLLDANKELLVAAKEWTEEFENIYQKAYSATKEIDYDL